MRDEIDRLILAMRDREAWNRVLVEGECRETEQERLTREKAGKRRETYGYTMVTKKER